MYVFARVIPTDSIGRAAASQDTTLDCVVEGRVGAEASWVCRIRVTSRQTLIVTKAFLLSITRISSIVNCLAGLVEEAIQ